MGEGAVGVLLERTSTRGFFVSRPHYRITAVAKSTGLSTATLRAWERRYGVPNPFRASSGYRLYSQDDVEQLQKMVGLQEQGVSPSESARLVRAESTTSNPPPPRPAAEETLSTDESGDPAAWQDMVESIFATALSMDAARLELLLHRAMTLGNAWTVYSNILRPVLARIGEYWARGDVSIAQEHFATAEIGAVLRNLVRLVRRPGSQHKILLACVAHENHELPLYGVALLAETLGWETCILGARTPPEAMDDAVLKARPHLVGLSVTAPLKEINAPQLFAAYGKVFAGIPWIVGGLGAPAHRAEIEAAGGQCFEGGPEGLRDLLTEAQQAR